MKSLRMLLVGLFVVVLASFVAIWFLPAGWAVVLLAPQLHGLRLEQVRGQLWHGSAGHVYAVNGSDLGSARWVLSRRAIIGDVWLDLSIRQPHMQFSGQMHRLSASTVMWSNVSVHVDTALLGPQAWLNNAQPLGWLDLRAPQMRLENNWPMGMQANGQWLSACVRERAVSIALGTLLLRMSAQSGIVQATVRDDGHGPLQMAGRLSGSALGWSIDITLTPRREDPTLHDWLRSFGKPAADGTLYLHYRGGLAALSSPTEQR